MTSLITLVENVFVSGRQFVPSKRGQEFYAAAHLTSSVLENCFPQNLTLMYVNNTHCIAKNNNNFFSFGDSGDNFRNMNLRGFCFLLF